MDASEVTEVCRLCPSSGGGEELLYVFDERLSVKNNMKEVILVTTGIEIQETDLISKKICHRCCTKTLQMFLFRQDALTQDRALKEKFSRFLDDKGIRLPNTCITIKRERRNSFLPLKRPKEEPDDVPFTPPKTKMTKILHHSVADIYKNYANIKLPKKCLEKHLAPVVSFTMGEVEKYFRERKLDMRKFTYRPIRKTILHKAVAKKKTSKPAIQKTVSPIKISKKLLESPEVQNANTNTDYVCTSVHKEKQKQKLNFSPKCNKLLTKIISQENIAVDLQLSAKLIETPKLSIEQLAETHTSIVEPVPAPVPAPVPQNTQAAKPITPTPIDSVSEDSRESCLSTTSKPEFIESLGLTPTVTATKSQTLHVCNLCGSVHNNAFKLKTHMRKHMVCQFCKLRFKTLETKQDHVDNLCQVKKIMNSPGPVVELEKVHLNLAMRKKYKDAFYDFEAIPSLAEPSSEQVIIKASSPLPYLNSEDIINLSDDERVSTRSNDLPLDVPTTSSNIVPSDNKNVVYSTVSIVKPDVRIKNSTVMNNIASSLTDKQLVENLMVFFKPQRARTVDKMLQTDLPANKDIKINIAEGYCEFKYLKEQLLTYKIPISITDGPEFHVAYQYKNNSNSKKNKALWTDLSVNDVYKKTTAIQVDSSHGNSSQPNFSTNKVTPVQSTYMPSLVPLITATNTSGPPTVQNSSAVITQIDRSLNNCTVDANSSTLATPLLQNFAQSTSPKINKPIAISKTHVYPAISHNSTSNRNVTSSSKIKSRAPVSLGKKSLPATFSKGKTILRNLNRSSSSINSVVVSQSSTHGIGTQPATFSAPSSTTDSAASTSESSRFRVKSVWELQ